jgi:ketosteroid isomerase-like protein
MKTPASAASAKHALFAIVMFCGAMASCANEPRRPSVLADVGRQWVDAWAHHRRDVLVSLYDVDVIFSWPTMKEPRRGKHDALQYLTLLWDRWADMELEANSIFVDEDGGKVAIDWVLAAKDSKSGNPIRLEGVDILQIRNGVITADRGIFDGCWLLAQENTAPTPEAAAPAPPTPMS